MSAISGFLQLKQYLSENPEIEVETAIKVLRNASSDTANHDYESAQHYFSLLNDTDLVALELKQLLRNILHILIMDQNYSWHRLFRFGRAMVESALSENELQVFRNAGLLSPNVDADVIEWWDSLTDWSGSKDTGQNFRKAELATLKYEQDFLRKYGSDRFPQLVSIEDNSLGYDVLSYRLIDNKWKQIYIEVKFSQLNFVSFYLTRNEYERAKLAQENFYIYFWNKQLIEPQIFEYDFVLKNTPLDAGIGSWTMCYLSNSLNLE